MIGDCACGECVCEFCDGVEQLGKERSAVGMEREGGREGKVEGDCGREETQEGEGVR